MRQFMMTVMALAALGAMAATAQAENQSVSRTARVAESASTCTGMKLACLSGKDCPRNGLICGWPRFCNSTWEHCMKTGFWEGGFLHRSAERR
jgi:hypothetical protein